METNMAASKKIITFNGDVFILNQRYAICLTFSGGAPVRITRKQIRDMFVNHATELKGSYNWYARYAPNGGTWDKHKWNVYRDFPGCELKIGCVQLDKTNVRKLRAWANAGAKK